MPTTPGGVVRPKRKHDEISAWLEAERDACRPATARWYAYDDLLYTYWAHKDDGVALRPAPKPDGRTIDLTLREDDIRTIITVLEKLTGYRALPTHARRTVRTVLSLFRRVL